MSGGVRRYITEKIKHWRARGGRHLLIVPGAEDAVLGDGDARVYTIKSPLVSRETGYRVLLRVGEIGRILEAERPDLVENADPYQVGWRVARECNRLRLPAVSFYHSHFAESELRPLQRFIGRAAADLLADLAARSCRGLYNQFARTLVPSPILTTALQRWGVENAVTVDMGVDTAAFTPPVEPKSVLRARLGLPLAPTLLLYVGRLAAEKNTVLLCDAMRRLAAHSPGEFHLIVAGEGTQRLAVESAARDTGTITMFPFLKEHARLLELYHAADIFVHPGVKETFGLVTAEAQACGLPVIGIRGTSMDRVVCHSQNFWAEQATAEALAEAIRGSAREDLAALGKDAETAIRSRFSWEKVFARQFDLYAKVVQE